MKFGLFAILGVSALMQSAIAQAQQAQRPEIWVSPGRGGNVWSPGTNQPVDSRRSGKTEHLNFDTKPLPGSKIVIIPDKKKK